MTGARASHMSARGRTEGAPTMDIKSAVDGTKATISLAGKLTVVTSPELEDAVRRIEESGSIVDYDIDLSELDYIASAGLRVLVGMQKVANSRGGTVRLLNPNEGVAEVFEMTGLVDIMTIVR
ncbi:MAG: STAS domain-containing protein [Olsenella sp.]|nr:STAS domain-containing protein [Olsenella sp.]